MKKIEATAKTIALLIGGLLQLHTNCPAQVLDQIKNSFNQYEQESVKEKIFVHTDKSTYLPGEIIWFKIYNVDAGVHKPISLSKVVYIDVLDHGQNAVLQAKIAMKNGVGSGSLYIPVSLNSGNYRLRGYTNWMKNFSPDYYFDKTILIVNPLRTPDAVARQTQAGYDVQFFPEGGNLISGITSKIAFKVTTPNGAGLDTYKGFIVDGHNDTVARFEPLKFGIGSFIFSPVVNNTYKAIIKTARVTSCS